MPTSADHLLHAIAVHTDQRDGVRVVCELRGSVTYHVCFSSARAVYARSSWHAEDPGQDVRAAGDLGMGDGAMSRSDPRKAAQQPDEDRAVAAMAYVCC